MEKIQKVNSFLIGLAAFLVPVFFIPSTLFPFQYAKASLVVFVGIIGLLLWFVSRIKDASLSVPWHGAFLSLSAIPLVMLVSAFTSGHAYTSLFGLGYEAGTVTFIALLTVIAFLFSEFYRTTEKIAYGYIAFFVGFFIVSLFQLIRLFAGPNFLSLSNFFDASANLIGRWNDLVIYSGAAVLLALACLELLTPAKLSKIALYAVIVLSFFFIGFSNFSVSFYFFTLPFAGLLGIFGLILFAYLYSYTGKHTIKGHFPAASLTVVMLGVLFTLGSAQISNGLSNHFSLVQLDARPSWEATGAISKSTMKEGVTRALLGSGPNRFTPQWLSYKPDIANQTVFWNTDFVYSIGFIPTFLVTGGILGFLSWIVFFVFFTMLMVKALFAKYSDKVSLFLVLSSSLVAAYLWVMNVLYVPSLVNLTLAFAFTGLFFAVVLKEKVVQTKVLSPFKTPQMSFISMLVLIALIIGTIDWGYSYAAKMVSVVRVQQGVESMSKGNLDAADQRLLQAVSLSPKDDYVYRFLSQTALQKLNQVVAQKDLSTDAKKAQLQNILEASVNRARSAVNADTSNYQNWVVLGDVYFQAKAVLGVAEAYDLAKEAYTKALQLNPKNPALYLSLARLEAANNNLSGAKDNAIKALNVKLNYLDAISFLSQLQTSQGDIQGALNLLEKATSIEANNPQLYFQIGVLRFSLKQYQGAADAFTQAISIDNQYANAKYYLAISRYNLGNSAEALTILQGLLKDNQDSTDLQNTISNIQKGKDAFASPSKTSNNDAVNASSTQKVTPKKK